MNKKGVASLIVATTMVTGNLAMAATSDGKVSDKNNVNKNNTNTSPSPVINGIKVNKMLIDKNYYRDLTINPKYIVIHDTDNRAYGAGAIANRNYFANHDDADASAHYIVDDKNIVQALEDNWFGWHIGDKYKGVKPNVPDAKNNNSIGIEITVNPDSDFDVAMKNSIELVKYLMAKHNIPASNVIRHNDATGKICPKMMIKDKPYLWDVFKNAIGSKSSVIEAEGQYGVIKDEEALVNTYEVQDIYREMNVAMGVIGQVEKNKKVKVNYVKDSWANITFSNDKGKSLTGFTKIYNLKINNLEMINKTSEIVGSGQVSVYKNLNGTPFEYIKSKTKVTYNYLYKKWANITYTNLEGKVVNGFVLVSQVRVNENLDRGDNGVSGKSAKIINASAVNVRADGNTESSILGLVYRNEEVKVNFSKGEWTNVTFTSFDGTTKNGYMKSEYIYINSTTNSNGANNVTKPSLNSGNQGISGVESNALVSEGKVTNISSSLRIRSGAGTGYDILGFLNNEAKVKINGKVGDWYKITYNGIEGYVSGDYISTTTSTNNNISNTNSTGSSGNSSSNNSNTSSNNNTSNGSSVTLNKTGEVVNVSTALKIRQGAGQGYEVLGWLSLGDKVNVISRSDKWYKINANGIIGFVHSDYLKEVDSNNSTSNNNNNNNNENIGLDKGKIINVETNLRVRGSMDVSSNIVGYLTSNQTVDILSRSGDWYKIRFDTYSVKKEGFVQSKYIEAFKDTGTTSDNGSKVVQEAKKYIGIDYLWGGSTPVGFDCSGLTSYVYKKFNINIGRTTWEQIKNGKVVPTSGMKEGDLIFFGSSSDPNNPTHVGMYVGNGSFLHSPKRGEKVTITKLSDYKGHIIQANRYI